MRKCNKSNDGYGCALATGHKGHCVKEDRLEKLSQAKDEVKKE